MSELIDPAIQEALAKHDSNMEWYRNNYHTIKEKYEGQFILIIDIDKVEYHKDIETLRERMKDKDINTHSVVIEYIGESDTPLMAYK